MKSKKIVVSIVVSCIVAASLFAGIKIKKWIDDRPVRKQKETLEFYSRVVNDRCNFDFLIVDITFGDDFDHNSFQDVYREIKCSLADNVIIDENRLLADGWRCSPFRDELLEKGVLGKTKFKREMYSLNYNNRSFWLFRNLVTNTVVGDDDSFFTPLHYFPPDHYVVALYIPEMNVLYYVQSSI